MLAPTAAQRGRWFVGVAVLGLLTIGQAPFVVLWALQAAKGPVPLAIRGDEAADGLRQRGARTRAGRAHAGAAAAAPRR